MRIQNLLVRLVLLTGVLLSSCNIFSQDPNFYIYLCFGQSNMEGQGTIEVQDKAVDKRFQVMEAVTCSNLTRAKGSWYTATPPLCRCWSGLSPADYFGRTMVENLPDNIKVGVVNVSVAGCKIELFDKDSYQSYVSTITEDWLKNIINSYGGNPYAHLLDLAKLAKQDGIIKGILLHQGESNTGDAQWPIKVKKIYEDLLSDLELNPDSVPLLAGEVVSADQGGICAGMNSIISKLPQTIPNSYVISSTDCTDADDNLHFNSAGYRKIGFRYAIKMLSLYGIDVSEPGDPRDPLDPTGTESFYFEPECATIGENWDVVSDTEVSNANYVTVKAGIQGLSAANPSSAATINIPFTVTKDSIYYVYGLLNCLNANDDSFWAKIDDADFVMLNGLTTSGWQWMNLSNYKLSAGEHNLTITYREDGAKLDKICISNFVVKPKGKGENATNICDLTTDVYPVKAINTHNLSQNYPNPFKRKTNISFYTPIDTYVSLCVKNALGIDITEIAGKIYKQGKHTVEFEAKDLPNGIYYYTIRTDTHSSSKKMIIQGP